MKKTAWFFVIGILVGIVFIALIALTRMQPYNFHGTVLQSPRPAPDFELNAANGQTVKLSDFKGKLVMLYFGYTFCPDVCPTSISKLADAMDILGKQADDVQVIMISVDPERDTPEMLSEYMSFFHPSFIGVTGTPDEIAEVTTLYGIYYQAHEGTQATGYLVDHTASVMVIAQDGHLKLVYPYTAPGQDVYISAKDIAADLAYLLK
jgi:protein SCO1/2